MNKTTVSAHDVAAAAEIIRDGGVVAFPTETYYGLAVDPFNEKALHRLFQVKGRPGLKPVLLLVAGRSQLAQITGPVPETAEKLMDRFWPGPLTLVLPSRPELSSYITGKTGTVGVRLSPHPAATALLGACGIPLTATSANRSGEAPAETAEEVRAIFGSQVDFVLDGGRTPGRIGSTLVGFEQDGIHCIREGCIPFREILAAV
ncbi:MAG: L-threonylcarbamoyladenylate synthase [Desulfobulbaceae bacterium]|nr:L-threonylcarbamoyladenylate synthase [Desulfobulbaceae bacterium]